jgi:hypothetical protein
MYNSVTQSDTQQAHNVHYVYKRNTQVSAFFRENGRETEKRDFFHTLPNTSRKIVHLFIRVFCVFSAHVIKTLFQHAASFLGPTWRNMPEYNNLHHFPVYFELEKSYNL